MIKDSFASWVQKQVTIAWEGVKEETISHLKLEKMPSLEFIQDPTERDSYGIMWVKYGCETDAATGFITRTIPDYTIYINISSVTQKITSTIHLTGNIASSEHILRFLLIHECRHIWQAQTSFIKDLLNEESIYNRYLYRVGAHGMKKEETDANEFALLYARDPREKALFTLEKALQETVVPKDAFGTHYYVSEDIVREVVDCYRTPISSVVKAMTDACILYSILAVVCGIVTGVSIAHKITTSVRCLNRSKED